jgi:predicted ATPase
LTQESAIFLDRKSPACAGSMAKFLGGEELRSNFESLTQAVRHGGSLSSGRDNTKPID